MKCDAYLSRYGLTYPGDQEPWEQCCWACAQRKDEDPGYVAEKDTDSAGGDSKGQRGRGGGSKKRTHCPQGHSYEPPNGYTKKDGSQGCRTCDRVARKKYAQHQKELKTLLPDAVGGVVVSEPAVEPAAAKARSVG